MFGMVPFNKKSEMAKRGDFFDLRNMLSEFFDWEHPIYGDGRASFKADIKENEKEYTVEAELPGVDKKDINLNLRDDMLTIEVKKEEKIEQQKESYIMKERKYGMMARSFYVDNVDNEKVMAKYENGILCITLPKAEGEKSKKHHIDIH